MEDVTYNRVLEVSPNLLENLMAVDALKIWIKNGREVLANSFLSPSTV